MIHALKIEPQYFDDILSGRKNFEIRKNDRNYILGDLLALNELNDSRDDYTGRSLLVKVTYVLADEKFFKPGYVALGITVCQVICNGITSTIHYGDSRK